MGRRGPQKKPTRLKKFHGTARRQDLERREPNPTPKAPKCPGWLPKEAKKKWRELAPEMERLGLLTMVDGLTFSMLLLHWSVAVDAAKTMKAEGITSEDERGLSRKHPLAQILRDNSVMFRAYAAEFGLSPSTRARLDLPAPDEHDEIMEKYFGRAS